MSDWEMIEAARKLTADEQLVLRSLREDGKGNYNPRFTRARNGLYKKGLADAPMSVGFGGRFYACVQHPTEFGAQLQRYLGGAA